MEPLRLGRGGEYGALTAQPCCAAEACLGSTQVRNLMKGGGRTGGQLPTHPPDRRRLREANRAVLEAARAERAEEAALQTQHPSAEHSNTVRKKATATALMRLEAEVEWLRVREAGGDHDDEEEAERRGCAGNCWPHAVQIVPGAYRPNCCPRAATTRRARWRAAQTECRQRGGEA